MRAGKTAFVPALAAALTGFDMTGAGRSIAHASFLDTSACIAAGWGDPVTRAVLQARAATGAAGAAADAMVLGAAAHALDFDDFEEPGSTHASAVLVPVILALALQHEFTVAQAEAAYLAGYSTILTLGRAMGYGHYMAGWHATSTLGGIGAAVCAGRLLQLEEASMGHAISLAMTQAAGLRAQFGYGAKAAHAGFAARNGIDAASLAAFGVSATPDAFEGEAGFAAMHSGEGHPFSGLSTPEDDPPWRKLSPCCGYCLRAIDAAGELHATGLETGDIASVVIEMAAPYARVVSYTVPRTAAQARFSVSWCVAACLIDGSVGVGHFSPEALRREDIAALEARVEVRPYPLPDGAGDMAASAPDRIVLRFAYGREVNAVCAVPRGAPDRTLSEADIAAKLRDCGLDVDLATRLRDMSGDTRFTAALLLPENIIEALA